MSIHYYYKFPKAILLKVISIILVFVCVLVVLKAEPGLILFISFGLLFVFFIAKSLYVFYFADRAVNDNLCPKCYRRDLQLADDSDKKKYLCNSCEQSFEIFEDKGNFRRIFVGILLIIFLFLGLNAKADNDEKLLGNEKIEGGLKHMKVDSSYWEQNK